MASNTAINKIKKEIEITYNLFKKEKNDQIKFVLYDKLNELYSILGILSHNNCIDKLEKKVGEKSYIKYMNRTNMYYERSFEKFRSNKEFYKDYLGNIFPLYNENLDQVSSYSINKRSVLSADDFFTILFDFYKRLGKEKIFSKLIQDGNIIFSVTDNGNDGIIFYNPINKRKILFIIDSKFDLEGMFTIVHEIGHYIDFLDLSTNNNYADFMKYSLSSQNGEVMSHLYEKLFMDYLLEDEILLDDLKSVYSKSQIDNYSCMLSTYILSLLSKKKFNNIGYLNSYDLFNSVKARIDNLSNIDHLIDYGTLYDVNINSYTNGIILSSFLEEYGIDSSLYYDYMNSRCNYSFRDLVDKYDLNSDKFNDLHRKEYQKVMKL